MSATEAQKNEFRGTSGLVNVPEVLYIFPVLPWLILSAILN